MSRILIRVRHIMDGIGLGHELGDYERGDKRHTLAMAEVRLHEKIKELHRVGKIVSFEEASPILAALRLIWPKFPETQKTLVNFQAALGIFRTAIIALIEATAIADESKRHTFLEKYRAEIVDAINRLRPQA